MSLFLEPSAYLASGGIPAPAARELATHHPELHFYLAAGPTDAVIPIADLLCGPGVSIAGAQRLVVWHGADRDIQAVLIDRESRPSVLRQFAPFLEEGAVGPDVQVALARRAPPNSHMAKNLLDAGCVPDAARILFETTPSPIHRLNWLLAMDESARASLPDTELAEHLRVLRRHDPHLLSGHRLIELGTIEPRAIDVLLTTPTPSMLVALSACRLTRAQALTCLKEARALRGPDPSRILINLVESPWTDALVTGQATRSVTPAARDRLRDLPRGEPTAMSHTDVRRWLDALPTPSSRTPRRPTVASSVVYALLDHPSLDDDTARDVADVALFTSVSPVLLDRALAVAERDQRAVIATDASPDPIVDSTAQVRPAERDQLFSFMGLPPRTPMPRKLRVQIVRAFRQQTLSQRTSHRAPPSDYLAGAPGTVHATGLTDQLPFAGQPPAAVTRFVAERIGSDPSAWLLLFGISDSFDGTLGELCDTVIALCNPTSSAALVSAVPPPTGTSSTDAPAVRSRRSTINRSGA